MARLRYTLLQATLAADIGYIDTAVTFTGPLREFGSDNIATIAAPDTIALRIGWEILHVTAYTSGASSATVARGQEDSTASSHSTGDIARHVATADDWGGIQPLDADLTALAAAGNSAVLAATTASFLSADETKLDGIATGATANDSDANLKARSNHTGTQLAATISDFDSAAVAAGSGTYAPLASGVKCIADTVLGSDAASITFASIPGTYRGLILEVVGRSSSAGAKALFVQFNGDTAGNYDWYFDGSGTSFAQGQTEARIGSISASDVEAGNAGSTRVFLPDYRGTTFRKNGTSTGMRADADAGTITAEWNAFKWRSTTAITSIVLFPGSGNLVAGSRATLWGVYGA